MTHEEISELLGAYALDATGPDERDQVEAHLAECPRCRAEVASHLEMAALLGSAGAEAPPGLWEKIAASLGTVPASDDGGPQPPRLTGPASVVPLRSDRPPLGGRRCLAAWATVVVAAAAVVAFLGVEVAQLHSQVTTLRAQMASAGLKEAELAANAAPHRTISLALADHQPAATVIVQPTGGAFWEWSSLANLPASKTYQLWGLVSGRAVSLALVGARPDQVDYFTVQPGTTQLMVTAEPEGGTTGPTTPVVASGVVPAGALS